MDVPPLPSNPDENEGSNILGATLNTTSLALVTVLARLYVRICIIRNFGWDDALMSIALVLSLAGQVIVVLQVSHGAGQHVGDVDADVYSTGMKLNFISQPIYLWVICVVKLSIGFSLIRIASTKFWKVFIRSIMVFMATYTLGCFFTIIFQCSDIRALWDQSIPPDCWPMETLQALSYTNVSLNMLTDVLFTLVIPIPMLWRLKVPSRTRAVLVGVLALGLFACIAAAIKVQHLVNYGKMGDLLWDSRNITIWTVTESNVGIVAGSIPTLRPLFRNFFGGIYGTGSKKTGATPASYGHGSVAVRSKNKWQGTDETCLGAKGEDRDDNSSERAINCGSSDETEGYELDAVRRRQGVTTVISARGRDDEAPPAIDKEDPRHSFRGITKVTQTTVDVSEAARHELEYGRR